MRLPRPPHPPPPLPFSLLLLVPLLCSAFLTTPAAAAPRTGSSRGGGQAIRSVTAMAWPPKCTWLPLPNSGKSYSYTLVSEYHKIWKDTMGVVSAQEILKKEPVSGVIDLKESMKFFDANFFNDSKLCEMEDGAKQFIVPAFRENRKLVALENGGLHNPSVLVFKSQWSDSVATESRNFDYARASNVHRPSNDEDITFMSVIELGELIRTKQITSHELTDIFLRRLKSLGTTLFSNLSSLLLKI